MEVVNNNDVVRNFIVMALTNGQDFSKRELKNNAKIFYNKIKDNKKILKSIVDVLYLTSYIVTYYTYAMYPDDEKTKKEMAFLNSYDSTEKLVKKLNFDSFYNLCSDTVSFCLSYDGYGKRMCILNLFNDKDNVIAKFPLVINDFIYYLRKIDENEIIDYYNFQKDILKNDSVALEKAVCYGIELLIKMQDYDPDNYKEVINSIASQYYTYNKYLLLNNYNLDEYALDILDTIESGFEELRGFSLDNIPFLKPLVRDFLEYNKLSLEQKKRMNNFFVESEYNNKILINNSNMKIREKLREVFGNADLADENVCKTYKKELNYLKNSEFFDSFARILHTDLFTLIYDDFDCYPDNEDNQKELDFMKNINNINELKTYLLEDDYALLEAINCSIFFDYLPLLSKKRMLLNMIDNNMYKYFITNEYKYDVLECSRKYNIYDAYLIYKENLNYEEDKKNAIAKSSKDLNEDLLELNSKDYNDIIFDICNIFYKYNKYKISNNNCDSDMVVLTNNLENDYDLFLNNMNKNIDIKLMLFQTFYEYLSLSNLDKLRVQTHYKELVDNGKVKIFNKKNKNS